MQVEEKFNPKTISPAQVVRAYLAGTLKLLDVRAPVEFARGHLPDSFNEPILNDDERHQVGIIYKEDGPEAAIALGHQLVAPTKEERIEGWREYLSAAEVPVVSCWRGGMRSETAQSWLADAGLDFPRIEGGYKALRGHLLAELKKPLGGIVIAGMTGTGKTRFLRRLDQPKVIDLERLANHKGSAFGFVDEQPAQQTFENALALDLIRTGNHAILEDESRLIGRCVLPEPFFSAMAALPRVVIREDFETRVENLVDEYVLEPRLSAPVLLQRLEEALLRVKNRLGGAATQEILADLREAFRTKNLDLHRQWIGTLLARYYDKAYSHAAKRGTHEVVFEGSPEECASWLGQHSDFRA